MGRPKKVVLMDEAEEALGNISSTGLPVAQTEKEKLLDLYQELKDRNIRSISDLENLIARAE